MLAPQWLRHISFHNFVYATIIAFVAFFLVRVSLAHAQQGNPQNWLKLAADGVLEVEKISGVNPYLHEVPHLSIRMRNTSPVDVVAQVVAGDVLEPNSDLYCKIVLAGSIEPLLIPAGQIANEEITGYCLETSPARQKPDVLASYLNDQGPIYVGDVDLLAIDKGVVDIITRAQQGNLTESLATQLAVWQSVQQLSDEELAKFGDVSRYAEELQYLRAVEDTPTPTTPSGIVGPTASLTATLTAPPGAAGLDSGNSRSIPPVPQGTLDRAVQWYEGLPSYAQYGPMGVIVIFLLLAVRKRQLGKRRAFIDGPALPVDDPLLKSPVQKDKGRADGQGERVVILTNKQRTPIQPAHSLEDDTAQHNQFDSSFAAPPAPNDQPHIENLDTDPPQGPTSHSARSTNRSLAYFLRSASHEELGEFGNEGAIITARSFQSTQIIIDDGHGISSPHVRIRFYPDRAVIKDLHSENGTFVNGMRLGSGHEHTLTDNIRVQFGSDRLYTISVSRREMVPLSRSHAGKVIKFDPDAKELLITGRYMQELVLKTLALSSPYLLVFPVGLEGHRVRVKSLGGQVAYIHEARDNQKKSLDTYPGGVYIGHMPIHLSFGKSNMRHIIHGRRQLTHLGDYLIERLVNTSNLAYVYKVSDQYGRPYAGKVANTLRASPEVAKQALQREVELMKRLGSQQGILPCLAEGVEKESGDPYFITRFLAGANLEDILATNANGLLLSEVQIIFLAILNLVKILHEIDIAHCDIKPKNIFISESADIYLLDMGSVTKFNQGPHTISPPYAAPELKLADATVAVATCYSDIYSLGLLFLRLLTGKLPSQMPSIPDRDSLTTADTASHLSQLAQMFSVESGVGVKLAASLNSMLQLDPTKRTPISPLIDQVNELFTKNDAKKITKKKPADLKGLVKSAMSMKQE